ncbi:hypothetical protein [Ensifer canadensis]
MPLEAIVLETGKATPATVGGLPRRSPQALLDVVEYPAIAGIALADIRVVATINGIERRILRKIAGFDDIFILADRDLGRDQTSQSARAPAASTSRLPISLMKSDLGRRSSRIGAL